MYHILARVEQLRELVFQTIQKVFEMDELAHGKVSEGRLLFTIVYPTYWDHRENVDKPYYQIELYSYLLCPTRSHVWMAATPEHVLELAETEIKEWIKQYEPL